MIIYIKIVMFEIKKQVVEWDDALWVVKRMIPESYQFDISEYRQYLNADKVAKKNGYYFFFNTDIYQALK